MLSSSPYVTSVGATFGPESGAPERACQADLGGVITSGGGFSNLNPRPFWQDHAVQSYFMQQPYSGAFNRDGRGYPDVSLLGFNYESVIGGVNYAGSGTSASAPVFAAMVSLVNAARLSRGLGPLGFLNILLYSSHGNFINDITEGDNSCSAVSNSGVANCCEGLGFQAARGWDPVTGLGSINFEAFLEFLTNLEAPTKYAYRTITASTTNSTTKFHSCSISITDSLYL